MADQNLAAKRSCGRKKVFDLYLYLSTYLLAFQVRVLYVII